MAPTSPDGLAGAHPRRKFTFEKVMQAAERAATGVSRRAFLGRLGRGALVAAVAAAGLAAPSVEAAAQKGR